MPARRRRATPEEHAWLLLRVVGGHVRAWPGPDGRWTIHPDDLAHQPEGWMWARPQHQVTRPDGPIPLYRDLERTCRECRRLYCFSAKEQQFWYEVAKIPTVVRPIRCPRCRHRERRRLWSRARRDAAMATLATAPDDLAALRDYVRLTADLRELGDGGNIDAAIGAARRWRRLDPTALEAAWCEARLQLAAKRPEAAMRLLDAVGEPAVHKQRVEWLRLRELAGE